jgi:hypothetical protein
MAPQFLSMAKAVPAQRCAAYKLAIQGPVMPARAIFNAVILCVALTVAFPLFAQPNQASAGSWSPVEIRRSAEPSRNEAQPVADTNTCVWTRFRGWHRSGMFGTWHGCRPGPEWRYERRCWIGPGNIRHCRFYG